MGIEKEQFDISISIETLEHVPTEMVSSYPEPLANALNKYSYFTVPNEIGIVFIYTCLAKKLFVCGADKYKILEFVSQALWKLENVNRNA